jgi:hypothetical protein
MELGHALLQLRRVDPWRPELPYRRSYRHTWSYPTTTHGAPPLPATPPPPPPRHGGRITDSAAVEEEGEEGMSTDSEVLNSNRGGDRWERGGGGR